MYVKWHEQRWGANNVKALFGRSGSVNRERAQESVWTDWKQTRRQVHRQDHMKGQTGSKHEHRKGRPVYEDATDRWPRNTYYSGVRAVYSANAHKQENKSTTEGKTTGHYGLMPREHNCAMFHQGKQSFPAGGRLPSNKN